LEWESIEEWRKDQKRNGTWTNLGMRRPKSEVLFVGTETALLEGSPISVFRRRDCV
jgi:hypothetical protein